jgi:uncharacterized protein YoxC
MRRQFNIQKIATYITGVGAAGAMLYGIFKFINSVETNTDAVRKMNDKIDDIDEKVERIDSTLQQVQSQVFDLTCAVDNIRITFADHLTYDKTLTKADFLRYMQALDVKKKP